MNQKKIALLWGRPVVRLLFALAVAILGWLVVTMNYDKSTSTDLVANIDYDYDSASYTVQGLDIVNQPESKGVSVHLEGSGTSLGKIRTSDLVVYPDYSAVNGAGEATLNLIVEITNPTYANVTPTISGKTRTVDVVFDTVGEKVIPVTVEAENLKFADGYILNRTVANPSEVRVSGPESEIDSISKVVAYIEMGDDPLSSSFSANADLVAEDDEGNAVPLQYTTLSASSAEVMLVVHQIKLLPLNVNFINVPSGFDVNSLSYHLSQDTISVSGPERTMDELESIDLESFDLSTLKLGKEYEMKVQLPSGLTCQDGTTGVVLTFDTDGYIEKTLDVTNVRVVNAPAGYTVTPLSSKVSGVVLIGPEEELEALSSSQVEAQIMGEDITITGGQANVPVRIVVPSSSTILAEGSYTVTCQVEEQ